MSLQRLRALIADDAYAITFQSMGQYRTHVLKEIDAMLRECSDRELSDEELNDLAVPAISYHGREKTKSALLHTYGPYDLDRCNYDVLLILRAVLRAAGGSK